MRMPRELGAGKGRGSGATTFNAVSPFWLFCWRWVASLARRLVPPTMRARAPGRCTHLVYVLVCTFV